ncbi:hypothetical protein FEP59_00005 [Burkholderia multivorans]|nr:hypothetical protein [Burkholderia multivorans]
MKITPLDAVVPDAAEALIAQTALMLPRVKITELLMEVDAWTGFTRHFTHLKTGETTQDKTLLLTTILADAINLGLTKMAEACPGTSYAKLAWLQAWHIRDETYSQALAELVNAPARPSVRHLLGRRHDLIIRWPALPRRRARAEHRARQSEVRRRAGPDVLHAHFRSVCAVLSESRQRGRSRRDLRARRAALPRSDLRIQEHYTDTNGFTDHVFALMHLLGFRFAPRIRDLDDMKLYVPGSVKDYPALAAMIGDTYNEKHIQRSWEEVLRLATSIRQGTGHGFADAAQARQLSAPETASRSRCARSAASSARSSSSTGCRTSSCAAACMSA